MEILREILVALHLIGMAIIVGGYFSLIRTPKVAPGMLHGSYLQLITGLLLLTIAEMGDGEVNHMKMGIKLVIAILVTIFAFLGNKKQKAFAASTGDGAVGAGRVADGGGAGDAGGDGGVAAGTAGDDSVAAGAAAAAGDGGGAAGAAGGDGGVGTVAAGDGGGAAGAAGGDGGVGTVAAGDVSVGAGNGRVATKVTNPSATMAHLVFAGAIVNVLVAVFVH